MDISLISAEIEYRAGRPKPLADYIRKFGLPKGHSAFVADIIDGTFKRTKRDTHLRREISRLSTLRGVTELYKTDKKLAAEHPEFVPQFANMDEVRQAVADLHRTTRDAIEKLEQRARKRRAAKKKADK